MTARRIAIFSIAAVLAVALPVTGLVVWIAATGSGLRFAWSHVAGFVPGDVEARALDGRLIGPLIVEGFELSTGTVRVTLERAELEWRPMALLARTFDAERLSLRGLDIVRVPAAADADTGAAEPFELPSSLWLPIDVNVESVSLDGFRLYTEPGAEPLVVDSTRFGIRLDDDQWRLHDLVVRALLFDADGRIAMTPRGDYRSEAEFDWVIRPPELPPAAGTISITGDARELIVEQRVAAPYELDATIAVAEPFGRLALEGRLELRVEPAELGFEVPVESVAATVAVGGSAADLALSGRVELPVPDLAVARVDFSGRYSAAGMIFESLRLTAAESAAEIALAGRVSLSPELGLDLQGNWSSLQWPLQGEPLVSSESGALRLTGTPRDLRADLDAAIAASGRIEGTVRRRGERVSAELAWQNVAWPQSAPRVSSDGGTLAIDGVLDDYRLTLDAALALTDGTAGHVRLAGAGNLKGIDLDQVDIAALEGTLAGRGRVTWEPAVAVEADFTADGIDPGVVSADWSGRVGGRVQGAAAVDAGELSVQLDRLVLSGELRDRPIELDARGTFAAETLTVGAFTLRSGATTLDASGTVGDELDFQWRFDSPDLADLWPELAGRLSARGGMAGPRMRPIVSIEADGAELDGLDLRVEALTIAANVDAAGVRESELELQLGGLRFSAWALARRDVAGAGDAARHDVTLSAAGQGGEADIALQGNLDRVWQPEFAWRFGLERASFAYSGLAPWTLRQPSSGRVTRVGTELDESCWQSGGSSLCVDAVREQSGTRARFALDELPFQYFAALFPQDTRMTGTVTAAGELALVPDGPPRVEVDVTTSRGRIGSELVGGGIAGLAFGSGTARLAWNGEALEADLDWPFERQQGRLELRAAIMQAPGAPFTDSAIDGSVLLELGDLRFLSDLAAGVSNTAGAASADIAITGTMAEPRIAGRVELSNGTARLRDPNIELAGLRVALEGDGSGTIAVEAEGRSGGGSFEADGQLNLEGSRPVGRIQVRGDAFDLFNTPDAQVSVSPDLRLTLLPQRMELTGDVVVPKARITPRGTTEGAIQATPDQVIVDAEDESEFALTRPLYAQVAIELGEDVTFDGFGLTGRLGGAVQVVEVPAEPTTGSGELRVENGVYEAYGQELQIRTGRLVFAGGALTRPGLDIEAVRQPAPDVLVGARVRGTLRQPELSVFSEPPMPRQEQLSYLILGRPLESASSSENSALSQASMALGLRGGNFVSERLNQALGFDEFGIQTQPGEAADSAAFVIGQYLSPKLYVSYGVGLFQPVNTLRLRYTISSRWRLVTESSSRGSGGDVIYHIERGE